MRRVSADGRVLGSVFNLVVDKILRRDVNFLPHQAAARV